MDGDITDGEHERDVDVRVRETETMKNYLTNIHNVG
jgi:hypothetical protein